MPLRSMTGFAQVRAQAGEGPGAAPAYSLSLKSVNHRYLDLQMRMPGDCDAIEMRLRKLLKEKVARGHVDLTLSIERGVAGGVQINRDIVLGYVTAFRALAAELGTAGEADLNAALRLPGALSGGASFEMTAEFEKQVVASAEQALLNLNEMREEEGRGLEHELRRRMAQLSHSIDEIAQLRGAVSKAYLDKVQARMNELLNGKADPDRVLQEAAMLAERSDIEEEIVRMKTHIRHFLGLLSAEGEVGKKLDFLIQEMNREANTLLSKTAGVSGDGLRITELGLQMKSEIEKAREQAMNIE